MIIHTLQKEQKNYHIQKLTQSNAATAVILDTCSKEECPFNAQILTVQHLVQPMQVLKIQRSLVYVEANFYPA
jgi:hypothetical protein